MSPENFEIKPTGKLSQILELFEAPEEVAKKIARRVGCVTGPNGIPHEIIETTILNNMSTGVPNWKTIFEQLGEFAYKVYRGKKI